MSSQEFSSAESEECALQYFSYRSPALNLGTFGLASVFVFLGGIIPEIFGAAGAAVEVGSLVGGLLLAGCVAWASSLMIRIRFPDTGNRDICEETHFRKLSYEAKKKVLAEFDEIAVVYLSPRVNMWSQGREWIYPMMLLTKDGRSIAMGNQDAAHDREGMAAPMAHAMAETIGCDVYLSEEQTPVKVVRRGHEFIVVPKDQSTGPLGLALVATAVGALLLGLWYLWTMIQAGI